MATSASPDGTGQTKPGKQGTAITVSVTPQRKVTFTFNATSSRNLRIPYAVAVNGSAQASFASKPKRVNGSGGKIETFVEQGSKVSLFLNSDAHPSHRKHAVYAVTVGENDVEVTITEKAGKHKDSDTPALQQPKPGEEPAVDRFAAPLTGDIWMKVSHRYESGEVDALVEPGTSDAVKAAVKSIYAGLASATLTITEPAAGQAKARTLKVEFSDSENPRANISSYTLLADGLTRVHPAGYAAIFVAALSNGIESLNVTSCWRPMLGSIAHRAGLGLDINYIGKTRLNRQELRNAYLGNKPSGKGDGNDNDNVSDAEVIKFGDYESAIAASKKATTDRIAAQRALAAAQKTKDATAIAKAQEAFQEADATAAQAAAAESAARRAWDEERDAAEPESVGLFRASLLKCACVRELFDPWYMEDNTRDASPPEPNMQRGPSTSNERLHAHHLHITVDEPKIL